MIPQELPLTNENRVKGMIALREQIREVIDYQMEGYSEEDIKTFQKKLNDVYDRFTKEYGLINSRANLNAFSNDSSYFLLCSLENHELFIISNSFLLYNYYIFVTNILNFSNKSF